MKTLKFMGQLVLSLAATCAFAQTIQITAGPAIAATATSPAWLPATQYCTGFNTATYTAAINTAQITATVPQSVLQSEMYGAGTCTITGLTPNAAYKFAYIGAEEYWQSPVRSLTLSANGVQLFAALDLFVAAGNAQNVAVEKDYTVTATAAGTVVLNFTSVGDQPKFDALIFTPAIPTAATVSVDSNGNTTIILPAGTTVAMRTCYVGLAGSTYVMFAPQVP